MFIVYALFLLHKNHSRINIQQQYPQDPLGILIILQSFCWKAQPFALKRMPSCRAINTTSTETILLGSSWFSELGSGNLSLDWSSLWTSNDSTHWAEQKNIAHELNIPILPAKAASTSKGFSLLNSNLLETKTDPPKYGIEDQSLSISFLLRYPSGRVYWFPAG